MIAGRQVLATIDQSINEVRDKIDELENRIESVTSRIVEHKQAMTQDYRELARVRLDRLADSEMDQHLDQIERQAAAFFNQRHDALAALQQEIQTAKDQLKMLADTRASQLEGVDEAAEIVDAKEAETQARLDKDPDYRNQRAKAEDMERKALHAEEKASRSEAEREQKGDSYRNDPLFMYLWKRDYGLPTYEANGLVRWLDGKVARLVNFADARANYSRLNEIPQRLRDHAAGIRAVADKEFAALKVLDKAARETDGIPLLEASLKDAQARLDAIDANIEQSEADHQALLIRKAAFATGDDEHTQKAVEFLAAEFKRDDLVELRQDALITPFPDDDLIINRLQEREQEHHDLEATIDGFKRSISQHQQRLSELDSLRMDFKRQRFDRVGSSFKDNSIIISVLGQFLAGMLDRGMLWKILREQQHYQSRRSNLDFGSGGFGRGSPWSGGFGDILEDIGRGSIGGGGSGGFRRGGGGGFRTGGGF